MENKRVRISDIAEELGVSTATVSNVIHGKGMYLPVSQFLTHTHGFRHILILSIIRDSLIA